jgi:hypothetical protein
LGDFTAVAALAALALAVNGAAVAGESHCDLGNAQALLSKELNLVAFMRAEVGMVHRLVLRV